jgi:hypothetical protein
MEFPVKLFDSFSRFHFYGIAPAAELASKGGKQFVEDRLGGP